jgi:hypothetical protein
MVRSILSQERLSTVDRWQLEHVLGFPWCWPDGGASRSEAERHGFQEPPGLEPGRVLLVAASGTGRASIWSYRPEAQGSRGGVPLQGSALGARITVTQVVTRGLPVLTALLPDRKHQEWVARLIFKSGAGLDHALDGPSFGLSFALATASQLLGRVVPSDVAASARVSSNGSIEPVGGLDEKIALLAEAAAGVRRLLVARADEEIARAAAVRGGGRLEVVGVATLPEAWRTVFPNVPLIAPPWSDDARLRRSADPMLVPLLRHARTVHEGLRQAAHDGGHRHPADRAAELYAMSCMAVCDRLRGEKESATHLAEQVLRVYGDTAGLPAGFRHHASYAFSALLTGRDVEADVAFAQMGTGRYRSEDMRGVQEQRDLLLKVMGKLSSTADKASGAEQSMPVAVGGFAKQVRVPHRADEVYTPRPRGEGLELGDEMMGLVEDLSRNAHDVWALEKMSQGWSFGAQHDKEARLHHDLVEYDELTETEKNLDRVMVAGTIKALLDLGYAIKRE